MILSVLVGRVHRKMFNKCSVRSKNLESAFFSLLSLPTRFLCLSGQNLLFLRHTCYLLQSNVLYNSIQFVTGGHKNIGGKQ